MCKERLEVSFKGGKRAGDKTKVEPHGEGRKRRRGGGERRTRRDPSHGAFGRETETVKGIWDAATSLSELYSTFFGRGARVLRLSVSPGGR